MRKLILLRSIGALAALLSLSTMTVQAATVEWTLNNVAFMDGSTATGSFTFDVDTNTYDGTNVSVSCAAICAPQFTTINVIYMNGDATGTNWKGSGAGTGIWNEVRFNVGYESMLSNSGGEITLSNGGIVSAGGSSSLWSGGSISASPVPVPAAAWLFGSALGLLGWVRRRAA